jgi:predicted RNase H-like HicB family nuclease
VDSIQHIFALRALMEVGPDGACLIQLAELPGCFARAPTREEAMAKLPAEIAGHLAWLHASGEVDPTRGRRASVVAVEEIVTHADVRDGDSEALFSTDRPPLSPEEVEDVVRLLAASRASLLESIADVPAPLFDAADPRRVRDCFYGPAPASIRAALEHIARAEGYYASRTLPTDESCRREVERYASIADGATDVFALLAAMRTIAIARFRALRSEPRTDVVVHAGEEWTPRKALRRMILHERMHARSVERMRATLLRGEGRW